MDLTLILIKIITGLEFYMMPENINPQYKTSMSTCFAFRKSLLRA